MATLEEQYQQAYADLQSKNTGLVSDASRLQAQRDAQVDATRSAGQTISSQTSTEIQQAQTAEAERLQKVAAARRNALMVFAAVGLVASVGVVVLIQKQQ